MKFANHEIKQVTFTIRLTSLQQMLLINLAQYIVTRMISSNVKIYILILIILIHLLNLKLDH